MKSRYLEVTFRNGKPVAAYLYLPRRPGDRSTRTERPEPGLVVDFTADGRPMGIEITAPTRVSLEGVNRVLARLGQDPIAHGELAPLAAA